jgi:hypothetical protein
MNYACVIRKRTTCCSVCSAKVITPLSECGRCLATLQPDEGRGCVRSPSHRTFAWRAYWKCILWLTQRSGIILEKLTVSQSAKTFVRFYGMRRFITVLTTARHQTLSWATLMKCTSSHSSSHLGLLFQSDIYPSRFPTETVYAFLISPYVLHAPPISSPLISSP